MQYPTHSSPEKWRYFYVFNSASKTDNEREGVKENVIAQDKRDKGVSVKIDACIICLLIA